MLRKDHQNYRVLLTSIRQKPIDRLLVTLIELVMLLMLMITSSTVYGQGLPQNASDPAARAMAKAESVIDNHSQSAQRILKVSKLLKESESAKTQGKIEQAAIVLLQAEKLIAEDDILNRGMLTNYAWQSVAAARAALTPNPVIRNESALGLNINFNINSYRARQVIMRRFNNLSDTLTRVLADERMPVELLSVAYVESGFNQYALSRKGARGIWQFMPATARRYGLTVMPGEDHRLSPEASTRAAARYLKDLYQQFGDWELALAAYNAGEYRIQRIIDENGTRNFAEMARRGLLPVETRDYVWAVMAVWRNLQITAQ